MLWNCVTFGAKFSNSYVLAVMKKRIVLAAAAALALASCGENSSAYKALQARFDSLDLVNRSYEVDLQETDSLVASVLTNFQDIASVEGMINVNPMRGDMRMSEKERIKDNVALITDKLRASSEALETLTKKLASSGTENKRLRNTLSALKRELEAQKSRVLALTEELQRKDIAIGALDSMVTNLVGDVDRLNATAAQQSQALAAQDKELHTVRYCIGTARDLKDYNLLRKGQVVTEQAELSYFTTADLRKLTQIPLGSKKAKLLTIHSAESYELVPDADKILTLNIKDAKLFWANSKVLIIQVD